MFDADHLRYWLVLTPELGLLRDKHPDLDIELVTATEHNQDHLFAVQHEVR
ncbi:hypothetical protein [Rhodococcus sp. 077-4]|uniref:hypothetical protein n=1 Tax=Rhodococcus sp. 077-4 TaxID=2789271 RepID=UPI0039F5F4A7